MLVQALINIARADLNDEDKTRYSDSQLLLHVQNYVQQAIFSRPDLFLGRYESLTPYTLVITSLFPMTDRYVRSCADYVVGRAMLNNTEENAIAIANNYITLSAKEGGL